MFGVLLESKAKKQKRSIGATFSVVAHVAIIAAAAVGTVQGTPAPPDRPEVFVVTPPPPPKSRVVQEQRSNAQPTNSPALPADIVIKHIEVPTVAPTELPPITPGGALAADSIVIGGGRSGQSNSLGSQFGGEAPSDNRDWDARELLMHVLTPAKPRYPDALRNAGVDGRVLVQFSVDTTGHVDMASIKVLETTHDLFTRAVRDALGNFRFRPAEVRGRRVSALAQMPFEFHITP